MSLKEKMDLNMKQFSCKVIPEALPSLQPSWGLRKQTLSLLVSQKTPRLAMMVMSISINYRSFATIKYKLLERKGHMQIKSPEKV